MEQRIGKIPKHSLINEEVTDVMAHRSNRLLLIEAWIIGLLLLPLYLFLQEGCFLLFSETNARILFAVAVAAVTLFFTLPYLLGILGMSCGMERGEELVLTDLFRPFSSIRAYGRTLVLSLGIFWKLGLIIGVAVGVWQLVQLLAPESVLADVLAVLLIVHEILLGFVLCLLRFPYLFFAMQDGVSLRDARRQSKEMMRAHGWSGLRFFAGYLPRIAIGILSVAILWLLDTLPRMCVAYFRYCRRINESMIQLEEYTNE